MATFEAGLAPASQNWARMGAENGEPDTAGWAVLVAVFRAQVPERKRVADAKQRGSTLSDSQLRRRFIALDLAHEFSITGHMAADAWKRRGPAILCMASELWLKGRPSLARA